jgi:hypothetical protein
MIVSHLMRCPRLTATAAVCLAGAFSIAANAQGIGVPGVGMPGVGMGVGSPVGNLPQRQTPPAGGGTIGVPGQMNSRMGRSGMPPGQVGGLAGGGVGRSRSAGLMGTPRNAAGFSQMARNAGGQQSSQNIIQNNRNTGTNVPGYGRARRGNR